MAVSNSCGSQIINILIGLGLPWTLSCLGGRDIKVGDHEQIQVMAYFQGANVLVFVSMILFTTYKTWRRGDHSKHKQARADICAVTCGRFAAKVRGQAAQGRRQTAQGHRRLRDAEASPR